MKKVTCILLLSLLFAVLLPAEEYSIVITARNVMSSTIPDAIVTYSGDYDGVENTPFTIGPYPNPFSITLVLNDPEYFFPMFLHWQIDGVSQADDEYVVTVQVDDPEGNEAVLIFSDENPSPGITIPPDPTPTITPEPTPTTICLPCLLEAYGYVTTSSGIPVEGATISMTTEEKGTVETLTDSDGYYTLLLPTCYCGEDALFFIVKDGYVPLEEVHYVSADRTNINFVLTKYSDPGGLVWFMPRNVIHRMLNLIFLDDGIPSDPALISSMILGDFTFTNEVHFDSGNQVLGAYNLTIYFDPSVVTINSEGGSGGISVGTDGFVPALNVLEPGVINVSGYDALGVGPLPDLHLFTIHWLAQTYNGTTEVTIDINQLYDNEMNFIGNPFAEAGSITIETITCVIGDYNSDNIVDIVDALLAAQYYVGLNPSNIDIKCGDVNCDGRIDIIDALLIAQYFVGLITEFC